MFFSFFLILFFCFPICATNQIKFYVFRVESSASPYYNHLQNANAADEAGVLAYLHTEVIPVDMGSGPPGCIRKFNDDIIFKFEVTLLNPPSHATPPVNGFLAYDAGKCTPPNCQADYDADGYYVGAQSEATNPRHAYTNGVWYSFPEEGMCSNPDGTSNCTFMARPVGTLNIDAFVNSNGAEIVPDYYTWCIADPSHIEMERISTNGDYDCGNFTQQSIDFWKGVCILEDCDARINQLKTRTELWNYTMVNGCDGSTGNIYLNGIECANFCAVGSYPDWDYICQPCQVDLHCQECNWAMSPGGTGGDRCTSCGENYKLDSLTGKCMGTETKPATKSHTTAIAVGTISAILVIGTVFFFL